jgi:hypothetical protein
MDAELEVGKTYKIRSDRKGTFVARITMVSEVWVSAELVAGKAGAMLKENEVYVGEEVTVRRSFCTFTPVEGGAA